MPYGYIRTANGGIAVVMNEVLVIRDIFEGDQRGFSLRAIATRLNDAKIPAPRGGEWRASSVYAVLSHRSVYEGGKRGNSELHWPIILENTARF